MLVGCIGPMLFSGGCRRDGAQIWGHPSVLVVSRGCAGIVNMMWRFGVRGVQGGKVYLVWVEGGVCFLCQFWCLWCIVNVCIS